MLSFLCLCTFFFFGTCTTLYLLLLHYDSPPFPYDDEEFGP